MIAPVAYDWIEWTAARRAHAIDRAGHIACGLPAPPVRDRRLVPGGLPRCARCLRVVRAHGGDE